ncbi:MAG: hypothetical protein IKZ13_00470 [Akkermansia sp.]|nr:hypothetical protein [Akkermansia sp.]
MTSRTLRAANALLYASSVLLVIAAILYCAFYKEMPAWQLWGGVALSIGAAIWGLYYVTLSYRVTADEISYHSYFRCRRRLYWSEIANAELESTDANGLACCHITLHPREGAPLRISSEVLQLDEVQELAEDLRSKGLLPAAPTSDAPPTDTPTS